MSVIMDYTSGPAKPEEERQLQPLGQGMGSQPQPMFGYPQRQPFGGQNFAQSKAVRQFNPGINQPPMRRPAMRRREQQGGYSGGYGGGDNGYFGGPQFAPRQAQPMPQPMPQPMQQPMAQPTPQPMQQPTQQQPMIAQDVSSPNQQDVTTVAPEYYSGSYAYNRYIPQNGIDAFTVRYNTPQPAQQSKAPAAPMASSYGNMSFGYGGGLASMGETPAGGISPQLTSLIQSLLMPKTPTYGTPVSQPQRIVGSSSSGLQYNLAPRQTTPSYNLSSYGAYAAPQAPPSSGGTGTFGTNNQQLLAALLRVMGIR